MIIDGILLIVQGFLNVLLMPLTAFNIGIDFLSSIPVVTSFLQLIAYILPWSNLMPLIILLIAPFALDMLFMLISRENQDLMDLLTRTWVVDTEKSYIFKDIYQEEDFFMKNPELEEEFMPEEIEYTNKLSNIREMNIDEKESDSAKN